MKRLNNASCPDTIKTIKSSARGITMTLEEMKARKKEMGLSNRELAALSGIPLGTVQRILSGETKAPRRAAIEGLEKVLDKSLRTQHSSFVRSNETFSGVSCLREPSAGYGTSSVREIQKGIHTVKDYFAMPSDKRVELIDGVFYDMAAPSNIHQTISMELSFQLSLFVRQNYGECSVHAAPFAVQLDQDDRTMVEPDIVVICSRDRQRYFGCYGAPDLVVEILSPATARKDMTIKLHKYLEAGVKEYWVVNPESRQIIVYKNTVNSLSFHSYNFSEKVPVGIWENRCYVDLSEIIRELDFLENLRQE